MNRIPGMRQLIHKVNEEGFYGLAESAHDAVEAVGDATHLYKYHRPDTQQDQSNGAESIAAAHAPPPTLMPRQSHVAAATVMPPQMIAQLQAQRNPANTVLNGPMRKEMKIAGNMVDEAQAEGVAASIAGAAVPLMGGPGRFFGAVGGSAAHLLSGATMGVGAVVEGGIRVAAASTEAENQQKALAIFYVDAVANQYGIEPEQVTYDHITALAQQNPIFRNTLLQAYASIAHNRETDKAAGFVAPAAALGGMAATAAMIGSGPIGWIAGMAGAMGGGIAGDMLTQKMADNHPDHTAQAHIEDITMKLEMADPEQPVTSLDIFKVRMHQKDGVAAQIAERYGKPFEELNVSEQIGVMQRDFPQASEHAVKEAAAIQLRGVEPCLLALHADICPLMQQTHNVQAMQQPIPSQQAVGAHTERLLNERVTALEVGASALGVV